MSALRAPSHGDGRYVDPAAPSSRAIPLPWVTHGFVHDDLMILPQPALNLSEASHCATRSAFSSFPSEYRLLPCRPLHGSCGAAQGASTRLLSPAVEGHLVSRHSELFLAALPWATERGSLFLHSGQPPPSVRYKAAPPLPHSTPHHRHASSIALAALRFVTRPRSPLRPREWVILQRCPGGEQGCPLCKRQSKRSSLVDPHERRCAAHSRTTRFDHIGPAEQSH